MAKSKKIFGDRWALVRADGTIARDVIGHRKAIYVSRKVAKDMALTSLTPLKVRDLLRSPL